ncbi:MAG: bifunctional tetrahydrofolate synthase/dihydrofolate synthase [Gammaproteobacteria bacterium]|nr:bifunctional tetrahydrofolate synthase/dihydrofolate synthase [Gammaproteobacteria bacterium]MBT3717924.1 bifunctional tetrahydrofolate synthase/dihydrofolate synthase [Gammaproteobacteria bacterium]MBT3892327.1 bifunctional tetrahydrofolate synthase/dihydrofolate synthase [Gammaproteobacteria bacterium]MBT4300331.1 bifunctional tetrahydrofolate synthase/dihydrofolate synthase [Gammaproteobacteria bacterium]MBT4549300.1 bifunctional tetrahydrofolate synthase/dihydrofolate synthase [Gammaprot
MKSLAEWLSWQETLHPEEIELGLGRVRRVADRLGLLHPQAQVVTVAGTNGKGSSIALLDAIARAAGKSVGLYTSPHLIRYNERIVINGECVTDAQLCGAFERVDRERKGEALTYFEFGTLAALVLFQQHPLDLILLEVGLGGRLDAVNCIDPAVALLTTVDLDHQSWLGESREEIGYEKAGIFRKDRPAVVGEFDPPASVLEFAEANQVLLSRVAVHYSWLKGEQAWSWQHGESKQLQGLPLPQLAGDIQLQNSAAVLEVFYQLGWLEEVSREAIEQGLCSVELAGRFQRLQHTPQVVVDVSHNPQAVAVLAANLNKRHSNGHCIAVVGMLCDKELKRTVEQIDAVVDHWMVGGLETARGCSAEELEMVVKSVAGEQMVERYTDIVGAYEAALARATPDDWVVVFGSFYTVAAVMELHQSTTGIS